MRFGPSPTKSSSLKAATARPCACLRASTGQTKTLCLAKLDPDDVRAKFELDFLRFAEAMDMVLPDPKALEEPYVSDLKWLARLRVTARRAHYQEPFDPEGLWREGRADHR